MGIGYNQPSMSPGSRLLSPLMPQAAVQAPAPAFSETAAGVTTAALLAAVAVRRGQPLGPTSDQEIEDFIGDALDLLPGSSDIEVRCDAGRATLTGQVSHKRLKRDAGEIAWAIPGVNDVQNNVTIVPRRRSRPMREAEPPVVAGRKQA
jgi:osmotically-inducible protein OsmY